MKKLLAISIVLAHWACGQASAQSTTQPTTGTPYVRYDIYNGSGTPCNGAFSRSLYTTNNQNASISLGSCEQYVVVSTTTNGGGSLPNIGFISLSGGRGSGFGVTHLVFTNFTSSPSAFPTTAPQGDVDPPNIGNNLAGISTTNTNNTTVFYGGINGSLTGSITVGQLAYFMSFGSIAGNITADNAYLFSTAYISGPSISGSISITGSGQLVRVRATSGQISGNVSAQTIVSVLADTSSITGNITATSSIGTVQSSIGMGTSTTPITISAPIVNIVNCDSGPIRANITASGTATSATGSLQRLHGTAFEGTLNVSRLEKLSTQSGWSNAIDFNSASTGTITVTGDVRSPISLSGGISSAATINLGAVYSTVSVAGSLNANLTAASTNSGSVIAIAGSVPSSNSLTITGNHAGSITVGTTIAGTIAIGHSLTGSVSVPASGLVGQVIVDKSQTAGAVWTGTVAVDGISFNSTASAPDTAPYYTRASSGVGGGAVGLAPYFLYRSDCVPQEPAAGSAIPPTATSFTPWTFVDNTAPIKMRFYGPVRRTNTAIDWNLPSGSIRAFKVECIPLTSAANPCGWTGGSWYNLTNSFVLYGPGTSDTGIAARTLSLGRNGTNSINPGLYRVTFLDVICAGVAGDQPVQVDEYCTGDSDSAAYYFRVGMDCNGDRHDDEDPSDPYTGGGCPTGCADRNHNGFAVQDIFDFLNDWFAGCTTAGVGGGPNEPSRNCVATADFNGSGGITVQDIFDFLSAWFSGTNC